MPFLNGDSNLQTKPLPCQEGVEVDFGVEASGLDLENLDDAQFEELRKVLYENQVVVIKNQHHLSPRAQYELTRRFDPAADTYSHGNNKLDKRSILHKDLKTIPSQPQVQVIGNGYVESFEDLQNFRLTHPHHRTFHKTVIPLEEDLTHTHFYRWHIDSAMYDLDPPRVTSLLAVKVPSGRRQTVRYDDGSGQEMDVPLGTTAFFSGYQLFKLLNEEEQDFVRTSRVEYAPHPYIWMSRCHARPNGLGLLSEGLELSPDALSPIDENKIKTYPMAWQNPITRELATMVYPTAARKIHLRDGRVIEDLEEVRDVLYRLQRRAIDPQYVYAHDWQEGDLVLFNNWGVMHSIVGAFAREEVRVFRQCNMAASSPPVGPE